MELDQRETSKLKPEEHYRQVAIERPAQLIRYRHHIFIWSDDRLDVSDVPAGWFADVCTCDSRAYDSY